MSTRSRKLLQMCLDTNKSMVMLPKWESTKGLSTEEKYFAVEAHLSGLCDSTTSEKRVAGQPMNLDEISETGSTISDDDKTYHPDTECSTSSDESDTEASTQLPEAKVVSWESLPETYKEIQSTNVSSLLDPEDNHQEVKKKTVKISRQPDFCFFCDDQVKNFARHLFRNHKGEIEVQRILAMTPNSIERKRSIATLSKKGNFVQNSVTFFKPVHKSILNNVEENYNACPYCLGLYSRKLLWKHKNNCTEGNGKKKSNSEGQDLLVQNKVTDINLRTKVFPRMLTDKVTLAVKRDALICAFGSRYLNTHRELHQINVCSRKMRELAKVLMECQKINPQLKNMFDILKPQYFDLIIQSVKIIAKFDPQKNLYHSPTFAMNISRSLKEVCDIAILYIIKRKYNYLEKSAAEAEANITALRRLIENTWKYEISSQAASDLNTKTWNKVTLVPLAADLKLFKTYLLKKGNEAAKGLEISGELKSFVLLTETAFCRLLLLNRRRVGELQRLKLSTYTLSDESSKQNYEEFADAVTPSEKILLQSFKRIVTRGKRGRGVPILFSKDIQKHIQLLIKVRNQFVKQDNLFLFANCGSLEPIVGYKVVQKHARLCGAKNPDALTSTKLRKHLATLTQIFNMSANDIEQLATFMGHTSDVHKQVYRLPDDIYQTAKVAKILMLMEGGEAAKYKGKSLEEIDVNLEEEILLDTEDNANNHVDNVEINDTQNDLAENLWDAINNTGRMEKEERREKESTANTVQLSKGKKRYLVPWTSSQKKMVAEYFKSHIKKCKPPKRVECETLKELHPELLENKSWLKIKVFVQNIYTNKTNYSIV